MCFSPFTISYYSNFHVYSSLFKVRCKFNLLSALEFPMALFFANLRKERNIENLSLTSSCIHKEIVFGLELSPVFLLLPKRASHGTRCLMVR